MDGDNFPGGVAAPPVPDTYSQQDLFGSTDLTAALKEIVGDDFVEKKLADTPLWSIVAKTLKLTFLDENDAIVLRHRFLEEKIRLRGETPESKYNKNDAHDAFNSQVIFTSNLKRAVGTTQNRMNERMAQLSHFRYNTQITQNAGGGTGIMGNAKNIFRRALGR